jgi:hypothetical protein
MSNRKTPIKPNGHAGLHSRTNGSCDPGRVGVNGHAPASTEWGGIPVPRDQAASVDTRRASAAMDASSTIAPGTDCVACAEVAPSLPNGNQLVAVEKSAAKGSEKQEKQIPGGGFPLPPHPGEFVEEIHRNADLFIVWTGLLNSKDEKIRQRAVEKLTEMLYKGAAALDDEPRRIIIDMPRPDRD